MRRRRGGWREDGWREDGWRGCGGRTDRDRGDHEGRAVGHLEKGFCGVVVENIESLAEVGTGALQELHEGEPVTDADFRGPMPLGPGDVSHRSLCWGTGVGERRG